MMFGAELSLPYLLEFYDCSWPFAERQVWRQTIGIADGLAAIASDSHGPIRRRILLRDAKQR